MSDIAEVCGGIAQLYNIIDGGGSMILPIGLLVYPRAPICDGHIMPLSLQGDLYTSTSPVDM